MKKIEIEIPRKASDRKADHDCLRPEVTIELKASICLFSTFFFQRRLRDILWLS